MDLRSVGLEEAEDQKIKRSWKARMDQAKDDTWVMEDNRTVHL